MAWPNPFKRRTPNTRTCWGYTFEWTDKHYSLERAEPLKFSYDTLGEECLEILNHISPPARAPLPHNSTLDVKPEDREDIKPEEGKEGAAPPPKRDLYILLRDNADLDPKLKELWDQLNTVPDWVDWEQLERGQDVFYRYGGANLTGLAYQSLLGGMGAARVVEVLGRTGGFSTKVARRRLFETGQHILQCTKSLDSIQPGGAGFASTIRVRLLHAAVRNRVMKLAKERPDYFNVKEWGIPINDFDCIATIASFSSNLLWLSLPRQGIYPRQQEIIDYIALWRYIAYLIGCPTDVFANPSQAKAVMESLLYNEIHPTELSKLLANNIIKSLDDQPPGYASADMLVATARWLNGHELCDALGLPRPSLYYYSLIVGQCLFFMAFNYTYRSIASWDKWKVSMMKKVLYSVTVESKYGLKGEISNFEFQYVPEYGTITEMTDAKEEREKNRGVERRNLKAFIAGVVGMSLVTYCGYKTVSGLGKLAWGVGRWAWSSCM